MSPHVSPLSLRAGLPARPHFPQLQIHRPLLLRGFGLRRADRVQGQHHRVLADRVTELRVRAPAVAARRGEHDLVVCAAAIADEPADFLGFLGDQGDRVGAGGVAVDRLL